MKIEIPDTNLLEELTYRLGRKPTEEELKEFQGYVRRDVSQWITDNAKSFRDQMKYEGRL